MNTVESSSDRSPRHPIQVVARRTGLTPDALRAWEKRYGAVEPVRASGGRRLYSDADIHRLLLLRRATSGGRRISQVAGLGDDELGRLVEQDEAAAAEAPRPAGRKDAGAATGSAGEILAEALDAVRRLEPERLELILSRAQVDLTIPALVDQVLAPLAEAIGDEWRRGELRISQEHLATAVVRAVLGMHMRAHASSSVDPTVIVTTPQGQNHELGALMAAVTATAEGWRVVYLGPDLPATEIAAAVKQSGASCVALSIVYPVDDPRLHDELVALRRLLGGGIPILVGGRAAAAYGSTLTSIDARPADSFADMRRELQSIRIGSR